MSSRFHLVARTRCRAPAFFTTWIEDSAYARRVVRHTFEGISPWIMATAQLLASELVANAIVHGSGSPALALDLREDCIHVEVHDADPTRNVVRPVNLGRSSPHGRGLAIVDALASSWGVRVHDHGKAVWFKLDLTVEAATASTPGVPTRSEWPMNG